MQLCSLYFLHRYSIAASPSPITCVGVRNFNWHRAQAARTGTMLRYLRTENPISSVRGRHGRGEHDPKGTPVMGDRRLASARTSV